MLSSHDFVELILGISTHGEKKVQSTNAMHCVGIRVTGIVDHGAMKKQELLKMVFNVGFNSKMKQLMANIVVDMLPTAG